MLDNADQINKDILLELTETNIPSIRNNENLPIIMDEVFDTKGKIRNVSEATTLREAYEMITLGSFKNQIELVEGDNDQQLSESTSAEAKLSSEPVNNTEDTNSSLDDDKDANSKKGATGVQVGESSSDEEANAIYEFKIKRGKMIIKLPKNFFDETKLGKSTSKHHKFVKIFKKSNDEYQILSVSGMNLSAVSNDKAKKSSSTSSNVNSPLTNKGQKLRRKTAKVIEPIKNKLKSSKSKKSKLQISEPFDFRVVGGYGAPNV
ncbi:hypothetical protein KGF54_001579 [Candida jiufengensis]|uniref:uncharacterized protein n=1 Tax=Candida jiufengensis TaxID=497108 RepID=UPI002224AE5A|nr:uncharacterized protein KGF54_001579 [Candida jiufengensis]KAI5955018.1 hypothetical protein KGF54_001579 [Candida jiufengensis]